MDNNLPVTATSQISQDEVNRCIAISSALKLYLLQTNSSLFRNPTKATSNEELLPTDPEKSTIHSQLEASILGTPLLVFSPLDLAIQECSSLEPIFSDGISIYISSTLAMSILQYNDIKAKSHSDMVPTAPTLHPDLTRLLYAFSHSFPSSDSTANNSLVSQEIKCSEYSLFSSTQKIRVIDAFSFSDVLCRRNSQITHTLTDCLYPSTSDISSAVASRRDFILHLVQSKDGGLKNISIKANNFYSKWLCLQRNIFTSILDWHNTYKYRVSTNLSDEEFPRLSATELSKHPVCIADYSIHENIWHHYISIRQDETCNSLSNFFYMLGAFSPLATNYSLEQPGTPGIYSLFHHKVILVSLPHSQPNINAALPTYSEKIAFIDALTSCLLWYQRTRQVEYFYSINSTGTPPINIPHIEM